MPQKTTAKTSKTDKRLGGFEPAKGGNRRVKLRRYRPWRKNIKPVRPKLPPARKIFIKSLLVLKENYKVFFALLAVYVILDVLFVHGFSFGADLNQLKAAIDKSGHGDKIVTGFALFTYLLGNSGSTSTNASSGVYQTLLLIIVSLALIWTLRQIYSGKNVRMREAFYRGMAPFIVFVLVLMVIGLQLLPLIIGGSIYNLVVSGGIAVGAERFLWLLLFILLGLVSLYLVCSSIFALYISTLANMTPLKALRSARELVRYRRSEIFRKLLFFVAAIVLIALIVMIPITLILTPIAGWLFFVLTLASLFVIHSYMYALYRELLNE